MLPDRPGTRKMNKVSGLRLLPLLLVLAFTGTVPANQETAPSRADQLFAVKILPLLKTKCFGCHGDDPDGTLKGDLDVRSRAGMLRGGESGEPSIVPGRPEKSLLLMAIRWEDLEMPPKKNDRLTAAQVTSVQQWIAAGAPWPDRKTIQRYQQEDRQRTGTESVRVMTSGGTTEEWTNRPYKREDLWAFRPVQVSIPPSGAEHPVDAFLQQQLDEKGLTATGPADRVTLIRRATYDLTGLPPSPVDVARFVNDRSDGAWTKVINRLLESPHYGEQWGRHWLDVVRYSDTSGYSNDFERSNAWRYRDYVVRSFNRDKPYDQFVREQVAGDEMEPDNPEMLIAVSFLRMGPWEHTGMSNELSDRQNWLDDVTNSVGQAFLSTALRCCRCHDHKFDPIPTVDYYRFQAIFATTQLAERPVTFLDEENLDHFQEGKSRLFQLWNRAKQDVARLDAKETAAGKKWAEEKGIPFIPRTYQNSEVPEEQKPPRAIGLDHTEEGFRKVRQQDVRIWGRRLERYEPMAQSVYNGGNYYPKSIYLRMPEKPFQVAKAKEMPVTFVLDGGSIFSKKQQVDPGTPSAVPASIVGSAKPATDSGHSIPTGFHGRRRQLAQWITDPANPLATRSIVNRIWQYHFGRGIASNPNNFGATGARPTHPELLDWLANRFVADGWSFKQMHRLVMTSAAYQRQSTHPNLERVHESDPDNLLLAYFSPRRLAAEEIRDSMLAVSGELTMDVGGLPAHPEINLDEALRPRMIQFSLAPAYQPDRTPAQRNRRSVYIYRSRGLLDPMLNVFNQPQTEDSCERRDSSNITPQVFTLLNSDSSIDRSIAFAQRLERESETFAGQMQRAFQLAYQRDPERSEVKLLKRHFQQMLVHHQQTIPLRTDPPTVLARSLVEEFSGKAFHYEERLDVYEDYQPHVKPWDVSAETRALADLCLVLMNSNEFIYIY
ncbi:MAG: PSD1 and planctomycete cytochrome C domain-containing protein [Planctomycetota bacterium]|nr:PSD1 and planctomycete cytochrome C domain-containing protein [Planctomycetota bacterium]